jgi:hypothetical protein
MRCTTNARCLLGFSSAESKDHADLVSEPLMGTDGSPAVLLRATTASSS